MVVTSEKAPALGTTFEAALKMKIHSSTETFSLDAL
jgi:hypothetical protein